MFADLLMDRKSQFAMSTLNDVNDLFVEMGKHFNEYLEKQHKDAIQPIPPAANGEGEIDPFRSLWLLLTGRSSSGSGRTLS